MLGLVVGVAAISEKLRHAADVPGSVTGFRFSHRTAQLYAVRGDEHPRSGPQTASHFALRAFCEVGNPSRCQGLVPCTHHPWQKLPYTVTRFCLLPQGGEYGISFEIERQTDDGLRGGDFDRSGKAGEPKQLRHAVRIMTSG